MPVCFGLEEFAIVTRLRCHPPSEPLPKVTRLRNPREKKISKSVKVGKKVKLSGSIQLKIIWTIIVPTSQSSVATGHPLQQITHLLQHMTHLLDTCPEPEAYPTCKSIFVTDESSVAIVWLGTVTCIQRLAWYYNMYPTSKPFVATVESSGVADDSSVAINDLSIRTSFWFNPNLTWYCNMYPTGKLFIATDDLLVRYATVNY
ncbi:hypothetical protein H5410_023333 [Solanum commersonii]|uniref:Uncharacterized protein n=1 Tax=Solanum commersonii TaxID=4109 RepID=A0A9J5ZJG3_SOLCO|nr:hypothetical protein H5410_023333 [Solanum commersonii]